ncbi:MAG: tyrosine-type recombinase/integrase [Microcoleus sp. SIO2G3]|nr:tyrosine-type recombinase/integrase [Microcoleus sp. SIO2G3]
MLIVLDGTKTGFHRVYPLYPEWAKDWELQNMQIPNCNGRNNSDLGNRVTKAFKRYGVPFSPYDLRHGWAIRSLEFGMPIELAAQQMGHSIGVHTQTYHRWISEEVHQRAYEVMLLRSERPMPPSL